MSESYEARRKRLQAQREADARLRKKKAKAAHKQQVEAFFGDEAQFGPKKQASLEQTLHSVPQFPQDAWQILFQQMAQAYFGMLYAPQRGQKAFVMPSPPRQIPENWYDFFAPSFLDNRIRASSAVGTFGICDLKVLLERANEHHKFFDIGERPKALKHGTDMHKALEVAERELALGYLRAGYPVSFESESLRGFAGLSFVQEAAFESGYQVRRRGVELSGHPDRVVRGGGASFILEAKTNLFRFSPQLVMGAVVQSLWYGLMVEDLTRGPVVLALTESAKPLERRELDALVRGNDAYFSKALLDSGKVGMVVPFTPAHRNLALYFLDKKVGLLDNPRSATGAVSKDVCDRYECPFRSRGCPFYGSLSVR